MGTGGVFAVASQADGKKYWTKIIGVTIDGFCDSLRLFALRAKEMGRGVNWSDGKAVSALLDRIADLNPAWSFTDEIKNAEWVSYSVIYNPFNDTIRYYEGKLEDAIEVFPLAQKVTSDGNAVVMA